jgi:cbb3-type cytochrome oxidase subunit 3
MIDWLSNHGGTLVLLMFFTMFLAFALWAFLPRNKQRMEHYAQIPLKETSDGK